MSVGINGWVSESSLFAFHSNGSVEHGAEGEEHQAGGGDLEEETRREGTEGSLKLGRG